jgi:hypothetical protein
MVYVNVIRGVRPELAEVCVCLSLFLDDWHELVRSVSNMLLTALLLLLLLFLVCTKQYSFINIRGNHALVNDAFN